MNHWSLYDKVTELIPFSLGEFDGQAAVYYGVNDDPAKVGFDFLAGVDFDTSLCYGYPVIHARIERYAGTGIRTFLGWIQIVTSLYSSSHIWENAQTERFVSVDICPALSASDLPFYAFGSYPQLFDAPCHNLGEHAQLCWTADTFLTTIPIRSREESITRLLGFRWGYIETDVPDQQPILLPLEVTGPDAWNEHIPFMSKEYPTWRFQPAG
jgi:hypothetical protein